MPRILKSKIGGLGHRCTMRGPLGTGGHGEQQQHEVGCPLALTLKATNSPTSFYHHKVSCHFLSFSKHRDADRTLSVLQT